MLLSLLDMGNTRVFVQTKQDGLMRGQLLTKALTSVRTPAQVLDRTAWLARTRNISNALLQVDVSILTWSVMVILNVQEARMRTWMTAMRSTSRIRLCHHTLLIHARAYFMKMCIFMQHLVIT